MEAKILVKSSSRKEAYTVVVSLTETGLSISCNCPAGEWGKYCKHKIAIILGDNKILYNDEQIEGLNKAGSWISKSNYPPLLTQLQEYEIELETVKKKVTSFKEELANFMKKGLK
jgi:uncharacterized Zn finger protein